MARKKSYSLESRRTAKSPKKSLWKTGGVVLAVAILFLAVLEFTNTTHLLHKQKVPAIIPASNVLNKSLSASSSAPPAAASATSSPIASSNKTPSLTGGSSQNVNLLAPYGNFVSNHHPGDNSSLDEVSVCNTTPGASCYIKFTNPGSGETTRLASQTADSNGSTIWKWNVGKDAHLSSGEWQVTATASLNDQIKSTDDQIKLEIK